VEIREGSLEDLAMNDARTPVCRFCGAALAHTLIDLGLSALANSYVAEGDLGRPDPRYPLHARICGNCFLVQVEDVVPTEEIFSDYAYFSSYSDTWVAHAKAYCEMAIARFGLGTATRVVEVASNDGYLLQHFMARGIPVLGIEPAANVAEVARAKEIPAEVAFFGRRTAERLAGTGVAADLIAANNVLAHVPDINDFVAGVPILLKPDGVFTVEFQHVLNVQKVQFDTICHEHFSYLSLLTFLALLPMEVGPAVIIAAAVFGTEALL
jgi:SAM-dependent methyltransferase